MHQSLIIFTERSLSNFPQTAYSTRFFETLLPFLKATTGNQKGCLEILLSLLTVNRNSGRGQKSSLNSRPVWFIQASQEYIWRHCLKTNKNNNKNPTRHHQGLTRKYQGRLCSGSGGFQEESQDTIPQHRRKNSPSLQRDKSTDLIYQS